LYVQGSSYPGVASLWPVMCYELWKGNRIQEDAHDASPAMCV